MNLAPEHVAAILASAGVLIAAVAYAIRQAADVRIKEAQARLIEAEARAKAAVLEAEREREEAQTDSELTRKITDEVTRRGDENSDLQKQLRDCEVSKTTEIAARDAQIRELQRLVHDVGEREDQKNKLLAQLGPRLQASEALNNTQENKIRELELLLDECRSKP